MRRIVFTVTSGDMAGGQKVCGSLMEGALEQGHIALLVAPSAGRFTDRTAAAGIPVRVLPLSRSRMAGHVVALARLLRAEQADLVSTHSTVPGNLAARLAARLARVPLVSHIHIPNHFPRARLRRACLARADAASARLARLVVAVSADTARAVVAQGYPAGKVVIVPNGVECPPLQAPASVARRNGREPVALSVGRLCETKGQRELIEAVALLRRERRVRLKLAGEDLVRGGAYRSELAARAAALGVDADIELCGHRDDVPALLAEADVFVLASFAEGLSIALLEAMAAGKPVVATRVGGTPEVVRDGENGLLVPAGDVPALAAAIASLLDDPARAAELGAAARALVERRFTRRAMVEMTLGLYDRVLEARA